MAATATGKTGTTKKPVTTRRRKANRVTRTEVRTRDPVATRQRILDAATQEFARLGFGGARVDAIARRARANKRMIYHYFGNKNRLFLAVLESAYGSIRAAEQALDLEHLEPEDALRTLTEFTWQYYLAHPEFLTLVNSENLHKARHLKQSSTVSGMFSALVEMVRKILQRGVRKGVFRKGIDPVQLNITIAAIGYYYLTNRFTGSIIFKRDLMAPGALRQRLAFNVETIMRLVRK